MSRTTAGDRMRRVLAVVPWIVANPGHKVADVAARFGLTEKALLDDLSVVYMVGLPPYSPDALVDVQIDDEGRVVIRLADFFSRPVRLTPGQALALLASSDGLLSVPGTDPEGALAQALKKLSVALGVKGGEAAERVDVHLGEAEGRLLEQLRVAVAHSTEVEIDYYSYNRDVQTTRQIAPWSVFADAGSWYVLAWCHQAEGERVFRVDRIESCRDLERPATVKPDATAEGHGVFHPRADHPRVTLRLAPEAHWVVDHFPCENVVRESDESIRATLVVTGRPWLERLLVQLGVHARIVGTEGMDDAARLTAEVADRILARYGEIRTDVDVVADDI